MYADNREQSGKILQTLDNAAISSAALAKKYDISRDFLLKYVLAKHYVLKAYTSLELTENGVSILLPIECNQALLLQLGY